MPRLLHRSSRTLFPRARRGSALSVFYATLLVGSALGFTLVGFWGVHYGWRSAFFLAGGPGLLLALAYLIPREPARGASEGAPGRRAASSPWRTAWKMMRIPSFLYVNLGMAAFTFAIGGLAFWAPTFLNRIRAAELSRATLIFGACTVIAGFAGTQAGGAFRDRLRSYTQRSYVLVPGLALLAAFPLLLLFFRVPLPSVGWALLFAAEFFLFVNTGPLNAAIVNVVLPEERARWRSTS